MTNSLAPGLLSESHAGIYKVLRLRCTVDLVAYEMSDVRQIPSSQGGTLSLSTSTEDRHNPSGVVLRDQRRLSLDHFLHVRLLQPKSAREQSEKH